MMLPGADFPTNAKVWRTASSEIYWVTPSQIKIASTLYLPFALHTKSTLGDWLADPRGKAVFEPLYKQIIGPVRVTLGGNADDEGSLDIGSKAYLDSLPLIDILDFPGAPIKTKPSEIVGELLKQVYS